METALHLSVARQEIGYAREWFRSAANACVDQDFIDRFVDYAHQCRKSARRHLAIVLRNDHHVAAEIYQELAADAYRRARLLVGWPPGNAVLATQAAYYASTARAHMDAGRVVWS